MVSHAGVVSVADIVSECFTAHPSIAELSKGGSSIGDLMSVARILLRVLPNSTVSLWVCRGVLLAIVRASSTLTKYGVSSPMCSV